GTRGAVALPRRSPSVRIGERDAAAGMACARRLRAPCPDARKKPSTTHDHPRPGGPARKRERAEPITGDASTNREAIFDAAPDVATHSDASSGPDRPDPHARQPHRDSRRFPGTHDLGASAEGVRALHPGMTERLRPASAPMAFLSDVHGNLRALDAVLSELARAAITDIYVAGD